jgi:hypothetical protein
VSDSLLGTAHHLVSALVPVPSEAPDVCGVCRSWKNPEEEFCGNCSHAQEELPYPCRTVLPISLYRKPSQLRDWLTYYKPNEERFEPEYGRILRAIVYAAWIYASDALWAVTGGWDHVVVVPSSGARAGPHPLEIELRRLNCFVVSQLLRRGSGGLGHREPSAAGYEVVADVLGRRVLVVDDVYTTGARSQSAASALATAGAKVCGILVVGRRINPDFADEAAHVWDRQQQITFRYEELFLPSLHI